MVPRWSRMKMGPSSWLVLCPGATDVPLLAILVYMPGLLNSWTGSQSTLSKIYLHEVIVRKINNDILETISVFYFNCYPYYCHVIFNDILD